MIRNTKKYSGGSNEENPYDNELAIAIQKYYRQSYCQLMSERAKQMWKLRKEKLSKEKTLDGTSANSNNVKTIYVR
jgi:hypothetical protein